MTTPTRQVALLRGINVGRNKRVAMAQLRQLLQDLGYTDVTTYLQSGNAVFTSPLDTVSTRAAIEEGLVRVLGVEAKVVIRTHTELVAAVDADPLREVATDPAKHLLGFLADDPSPAGARALAALEVAPDLIRLLGREVYLWCPAGVLASPLSKVAWDRPLGVSVTMRNWNTVTKLVDLTRG